MRSYRKELWFDTRSRREFINITSEVETCLEESRIKEEITLVTEGGVKAFMLRKEKYGF